MCSYCRTLGKLLTPQCLCHQSVSFISYWCRIAVNIAVSCVCWKVMTAYHRLRTRPHNTMINKTTFLNDTDFIIRTTSLRKLTLNLLSELINYVWLRLITSIKRIGCYVILDWWLRVDCLKTAVSSRPYAWRPVSYLYCRITEEQRSTITRAHSHSVSIPCIARGWYKPEGRNFIFYNLWKTAKNELGNQYYLYIVLRARPCYNVCTKYVKKISTTRIIELRWPNFEKVCFNAILCQTWLTAFWHENITVYEMLSDNHFIPVKLSYLIPV